MIRRREFIAGLGGAAVALPLAGHAQQPDRMRRIGVLLGSDENNPARKAALSGFMQALGELGWTDGRNLRMDVRWDASTIDRMRMIAKELVALQPDVIFATTRAVTAALQRETRTIPIVFAAVSDPVKEGFVAGLPRPRGNVTGFINMEAGLAGKWLQLLTVIAPGAPVSMPIAWKELNALKSGAAFVITEGLNHTSAGHHYTNFAQNCALAAGSQQPALVY
jgi:putative ABC transport system substrate-binding protein